MSRISRKRVSKSIERINSHRPAVFKAYLIVFSIALGVLFSFASLHVVRKPIESSATSLAEEGIPSTIQMIREDPWVIPLLIVAIVFLWSVPWRELSVQLSESNSNVSRPSRQSNVGRGRRIGSRDLADHDSMQQLIRQRKRRPKRK